MRNRYKKDIHYAYNVYILKRDLKSLENTCSILKSFTKQYLYENIIKSLDDYNAIKHHSKIKLMNYEFKIAITQFRLQMNRKSLMKKNNTNKKWKIQQTKKEFLKYPQKRIIN